MHVTSANINELEYQIKGRTLTITGKGTITKGYIKKIVTNDIDTVLIEDGILKIADQAFFLCDSLISIKIPSSIKYIGREAFIRCCSLKNICVDKNNKNYCSNKGVLFDYSKKRIICYPPKKSNSEYIIPDSITSIYDLAFNGCSLLESIDIPDTVTHIGNSAFGGCNSLKYMKIPSSVTFIGDSAFGGCSSLESIDIPNTVTHIGNSAFKNCSSLKNICVNKNNKTYCSREGVLINCLKKIIMCYPPKKTDFEYIVPNDIEYIGDSAFNGCSSLKNITMSDHIVGIGDSAFNGCSSLESIDIPNTVTHIGDSAFRNCSLLKFMKIPSKVTSIGNSTFRGCSSLEFIEIPYNVTSINNWAFSECNSLRKNPIHDKVTYVGSNVFRGVPHIAVFHALSELMKTVNESPSRLYRYRSIERAWSEIKKQYIYFSSPLKNNDPFDGWYSLKDLNARIDEEWNEYKKFDDKLSFRESKIKEAKEQARELLDNIGICCFSKRCNNLQLWSLYASNHTGICICYDPNKFNFNEINKCLKVEYSKIMKANPFKQSLIPDETEIVKAWFNKSFEYMSEEEWRIVNNKNGQKDVTGAIDTIYIGENIDQLPTDSLYKLEDIISFCIENDIKICYMDKDYYRYRLISKTIYAIDDEKIDENARRYVSSVIKKIGIEIDWNKNIKSSIPKLKR